MPSDVCGRSFGPPAEKEVEVPTTGTQEQGSGRTPDTLEASVGEEFRRSDLPGLSVAVVRGGHPTWARGFGFADLATESPATPQTSYLWFSMTKIVTATAVLRLAESGLLDLDIPVTDYFPGFSIVSQPVQVTARHLLSHSSGLANPLPIRWVRPAGTPAPDHRAFVNRLLARHRRLKFSPGEGALYSNLGYLVLGEVISAASGTSYEEYVRGEILSPLGMTGTGFSYPDPAERTAATGYQPLRRPFIPLFRAALPRGMVGPRHGRYVALNPFYVNGPPYGGLVGGVEEAARFVLLHLNGGQVNGAWLLSQESVAMMQQTICRGSKRDFGLGWYRPRYAAQERPAFVQHLGGGAGFWNVMRVYTDESLGVVMMGNTTRYDHESILDAIVRLHLRDGGS